MHAESLLVILNRKCLTVSDLEDQSVEGLVRSVGKLVVKRLIPHIFAKNSSICSEARDGDSDIVINLKDLILVASQLGWQLF
jgi:hypothetical protein